MNTYEDFPVLYPLCQVKDIQGNYTKFCLCPAPPPEVICRAHKHLRESGKGNWDGINVTWKPLTPAGAADGT